MESLVLNYSSIPVSIVPCRRAVTLVMSEKAVVLESYPDIFMRSSSTVMPMPSVIQCTSSKYFPKKYVSILPFTRKNVYIRDHGCCQYCGHKVGLSSFSFDHVIPQCRGGKTCWDNIVICCMKCNSEKGSKSVNRYKRQLLRQPFAPRLNKAAPAHLVNKIAMEIPHETWVDYVYWSVILED
jgi:5-methylcytosine-specific restriction endonuclease McrA